MSEQLPNPSKLSLYSGLAVLVGLTIVFFVFFVSTIFDMYQQWNSDADVFVFNKGMFYIPGVVLGLSVLLYAIIRESVLRKHLTEKIASYCTYTGLGAVVIMLAVPNFVEYGIAGYFEKLEYQVCEAASHQWLHSKVIAYARDEQACSSFLSE